MSAKPQMEEKKHKSSTKLGNPPLLPLIPITVVIDSAHEGTGESKGPAARNELHLLNTMRRKGGPSQGTSKTVPLDDSGTDEEEEVEVRPTTTHWRQTEEQHLEINPNLRGHDHKNRQLARRKEEQAKTNE